MNRIQIKNTFLFLVLVPTFLFICSSFVSSNKGNKGLKVGKSAPMSEVKLQDIDNSTKSLNDLKLENGLLVVFSCNTCPFVVGNDHFAGWEVQYNELNALALDKKVGMVLINSNEAKRANEDSFEAMKLHASEKGYTMPYLVDADSKMADAFGAKTTPHVYLFDKNMKLVYAGSIDNTWDTKRTEELTYLKNSLETLSKGEKIKEKETTPRGCSIKRK
jgi:peroxiredoxin